MGQWVAIDSTSDRHQRALQIAAARDRVLSGDIGSKSLIRDVIATSWERSRLAGVNADAGLAPVTIDEGEARSRWEEHPFARAVAAVRELLIDTGQASHQVLLFCDSDGTILCVEGESGIVSAAREARITPGALWSEAAAGTNAMGTALATGHPVQIFSAEHYAWPVHGWTCSAAPVRDPITGRPAGVLDLSGGIETAHPHSLAVVSAAARIMEDELRRLSVPADVPLHDRRVVAVRHTFVRPVPRPIATVPVSLAVLGQGAAELTIGDVTYTLSPRHGELLTLMALRPSGWTTEQLALELLGEFGKAVSIRAELSRLRRILGSLLLSHPYRLSVPIETDFGEVERLLGLGDVAGSLARFADGELLADSSSPAITEARFGLTMTVREAVIASGDPELIASWLKLPAGDDDVQACRSLMALCPSNADPRHVLAAGRLRRLAARQ